MHRSFISKPDISTDRTAHYRLRLFWPSQAPFIILAATGTVSSWNTSLNLLCELCQKGTKGPSVVKNATMTSSTTHMPSWRRSLNDELNCNASYTFMLKIDARESWPGITRESVNTRAGTSSVPTSTGMAVCSGIWEVVDIVGSARGLY